MSKHTPGPWFLRPRDSADSLYDIANKLPDGGMWHVASCNRLRDEVEANARLIAAAPTMYAYVEGRADAGDSQARALLENIHACR